MNPFDKIREIYSGECYTIEKSKFGLPEGIGWTISNSDYLAEVHLKKSDYIYNNTMQDKILMAFINDLCKPENKELFKGKETTDIMYFNFPFSVLNRVSNVEICVEKFNASVNNLDSIVISYTGAELKYIK